MSIVYICCSGPDPDIPVVDNCSTIFTIPEENFNKKTTQAMPMSGPDLAALMKVGTRVMRGVDWKWGDQVIFLDLWKKRMNLIVLVRNLLFICREDVFFFFLVRQMVSPLLTTKVAVR